MLPRDVRLSNGCSVAWNPNFEAHTPCNCTSNRTYDRKYNIEMTLTSLGRACGAVARGRSVGLLGGHHSGAGGRQHLTAAQLAALLLFAHEAANTFINWSDTKALRLSTRNLPAYIPSCSRPCTYIWSCILISASSLWMSCSVVNRQRARLIGNQLMLWSSTRVLTYSAPHS